MNVADLALLDDLWDEMARGRIFECSLRATKLQVEGLQSGQDIFIDPRPAILETLVHELLHRRKPRWSERRVSREARKLAVRMDDATKARWWRQYRKVKRSGPPVVVDED